MRWFVVAVLLATTVCFIWTEQRGVQNDLRTAQSDICSDAKQLTEHNQLAEQCRHAKRMLQMEFGERLQHRAILHAASTWHFFAQHQFLKTWYVQLTAPFVFVAFLYLRNDSNKERIRQDYNYKVFHENLAHTLQREEAQQEMFNEMFMLYRNHLPDPRQAYRLEGRLERRLEGRRNAMVTPSITEAED